MTEDGSTYSGAIAITDGTPDDLMTYLLCSKLNGPVVTAIMKPTEGTRYGSVQGILNFIGPKMTAFLMILDRENESDDEIRKTIESFLLEHGCTHELIHSNDYLEYNCTKGPHTFSFFVVISGLDQVNTRTHCIEDHLCFAGDLNGNGDSKTTWRNLSDQERDNIISSLTGASIRRLTEIFPQHISGIESYKNCILGD